MKTRTTYLLSLMVWASATAAWSQELPPPPPAPALPSQLATSPGTAEPAAPYATGPVYAPPGAPAPGQVYPYGYPPGSVIVAPGPYPYPPSGPYPGPVYVSPRVVLAPPPPLQSLPWSANIDAMFLERSSGGSIPLGFTAYNSAVAPAPPAVSPDTLYSDDQVFPLTAGIRLELSRKFDNDITLSATYWGLQQWSVNRTIYGDPAGDTVLAYSPWLQLPTLLSGMDNSLGYTYSSQIDNIEFNTMLRLNPGDPYWEVNWLWGVRYIYFNDNMTLVGSDAANSASETLSSNASNNLIGAQTGLYFVRGWSHFQWESGLKVGLMANIYHQHLTDSAENPPAGFNPGDISASGSDLSGLFEVSVGVRYRLTENFGLRLGYQFYDITGLALGPRQLGNFGHGGNVAFDGLSIGIQGTW